MNLKELVESYNNSPAIIDFNHQKAHYENLRSIEEAIDNACFGMYKVNGLTFFCDHFKYAFEEIITLYDARTILLENIEILRNSNNFHALYNVIGNLILKVKGIGSLLHYDITLRIGYYLRLSPTKVYCQRGALWGYGNLKGVDLREHDKVVLERIDLINNYPSLNLLSAHEIENFFCVYDKELKNIK